MANLADLLFPQAAGGAVVPPAEAEYWKAWHPETPYTGALAQQQEIVRLRDMEEQNLRGVEREQSPQGQVQAPMNMEQAVQMQNQQALQGGMTPVEGGYMAPPMQAVAPPAMPQSPVQDIPMPLQQIPQVGAPLGWGKPPAGPGMSAPPQGMSPQPTQPPQGGMQAAPMAPPSQAPSMAPPMQAPAQAISPPASPEEFQQRATGWQGMLENLKKPEVFGPLQTFFTALAAPLAPWETPGSRIGRASMMMGMHKEMLQQNLQDRPRAEEMADAELAGKQAEVTGRQAQARKTTVDAEVAELLKDTTIAKARQDLDNARTLGDKQAEEAAMAKLKTAVYRAKGSEREAAEILQILSNVKYQQRMATVAETNARTGAQRTDIAERALASKGKLSELPDAEAAARINAYAQAFRSSGAAGQEGADQITWLTENKVDVDDFLNTIAKLQSKGIPVEWKTSGQAGKPSGTKPNYTLDAQGNLK